MDNYIRRQFPLLGSTEFKLHRANKHKLEPLPDHVFTPSDIKQWGKLKSSALYIVPDTELEVQENVSVFMPPE